MLLLRQLEFSFRNPVVTGGSDPGRVDCGGKTKSAGVVNHRDDAPESNVDLDQTVQELLRSNGANRLANEVRVRWNPRLKTCAGRADYRNKLITLNPQLSHHPGEIDRTLRHELAHLLAQFRVGRRRIAPHGSEWRKACRDLGIGDEKRCHALSFGAKNQRGRFLYRCPKCWRDFPRIRRIRHAVACLTCCRAHSRGKFDPRFRLRLVRAA